MHDTLYTNGAIAVMEKSLLGDKLLRFSEMSAEEVFRALTESGFGSGSEAKGSFDGELLCAAEENALDGFIRTYAPSRAVKEYLLSPRDFHNMKALVKAQKLNTGAEKMFTPEGLYTVEELSASLTEERKGILFERAKRALEEDLTGAEIGFLFDEGLCLQLGKVCRKSLTLMRLLEGRTDRMNLLTVFRSQDREEAEKFLLPCGKLEKEELLAVLDGEFPAKYQEFCKRAQSDREKKHPFTAAENELASFEWKYFNDRKYELAGKEPFLYYVFRRRAEIANVRILLVCLNAGLNGNEITKRLRAI